jgi:hypothetical protein
MFPMMKRTAFLQLTLSLTIAAGSTVAFATDSAEDDPGVRITPKANNMYAIGDEVVPFAELESRLTGNKPSRIVVEASRAPKGAACVIMLGVQLGVPVWTRSYNGRMKKLDIDADAKDVKNLDKCR